MRRTIVAVSRASTRGLSLVELLVSLALGVTLGGVMVAAYLGAKSSYFYDAQVARMQENGRYALRLLTRELAMAGFHGGTLATEVIAPGIVGTDCSDVAWALDRTAPLALVDDYASSGDPVTTGGTALTCLQNSAVVPGSDLLAVKRTAGEASLRRGVVAQGLTASSAAIWYLRVESGTTPRWERRSPRDLLDASMAVSTLSLWEALARVFFVRSYSELPADRVPTLCMESLAGNAMSARCLVEGIENLQLEFGLDTDGDGAVNRYSAAPTGNELRGAVTARVALLVRSIDPVTGHRDSRSYLLGQKLLPPVGDAYLRRVFSTTVQLGNRIDAIASASGV